MFGSALRSKLLRPSRNEISVRDRNVPAFFHRPMHDWERRLHIGLCITWPCEASLELQSLWVSVSSRVKLAAAPDEPSDLNPGLSRAVWCLTRHTKPRVVVEAGVGNGLISRFILEALALNGAGQLYSIDPQTGAGRTAIAVEPRVADRWSLISDTTKRALPAVISRLGAADIFVHDGREADTDMRFAIDYAWLSLKPGGALVLANIETAGSLQYFYQRYPGRTALVCDAESAHVDPNRRDRGGLFAVIFKNPKAS
jgi:predicted O-methyltransferase YrrM